MFGDVIQGFGTLPMLIFTIHYGFVRPIRGKVTPWWKSGAGVMLFLMSFSFLIVQILIFTTLLLGSDFAGREL